MKLIVGLGNPGSKYAKTRHNLGFFVLDSLARDLGLSWRYSPDWVGYHIKTENFVLLKPATFMNRSGTCVSNVAKFFKIPRREVLVIHDDLDLPFGKVRLSFDSLSAGHKGVDSVIEGLSGLDFGRLRVGVGSPSSSLGEAGKPKKKKDIEIYVLKEFKIQEQKKLPEVIKICKEALGSYLADGIEATMNRFN